jgi:hypothetical protein
MGRTDQQQREWFREHWAHGIPFNQHRGTGVNLGFHSRPRFASDVMVAC